MWMPRTKRMGRLPVGINLGASMQPEPGFVLGAEVSLWTIKTRIKGEFGIPEAWAAPWGGVYLDGLFDFGNQRGRLSVGPEFGFGHFGIDGGAVLQMGGPKVYAGGQARLFVTVAFFSLYSRLGFVPADPVVSRYVELGTLLKFPIRLK